MLAVGAAAGRGGPEDEPIDPIRMHDGDLLGDHPAHADTEDVRSFHFDGVQEADGVVFHLVNAVRARGLVASASAPVIEGYHLAALGQFLRQDKNPVEDVNAQAHDEEKGVSLAVDLEVYLYVI
jgi:hypothetical protein